MAKPFSTLPLDQSMLDNLESLGYPTMTPVQEQSLPALLEGRDVIAQAQTGSGKTVAFGLSLLNRLQVEHFRVQTLVLCPTRELAQQVAQEVRNLARMIHNVKVLPLCGGMPFGPQVGSLEHGAHIIVGTPGRVLHHLRRGTLSLRDLNTLVLDEADRMLDMGFEEEIDSILQACPDEKQTLLFSATFPDNIRSLSQSLQNDPVEVTVEGTSQHDDIEQVLYEVDDNDEKLGVLEKVLLHHQPASCLIFCQMKVDADGLADALWDRGFSALAMHGDLDQKARNEVLVLFSNGSSTILVATDVAARGLDIKDLEMVVTFDLPRDPEVHVHRIGRTGRAGSKGIAISLAGPKDGRKLQSIQRLLGAEIPRGNIEELPVETQEPSPPEMVTLCLDAGKKKKIRPGDILGALTKEGGLPGDLIGKINIFAHVSYVAVHHSIADDALEHFTQGNVKGRQRKVRKLS
ncbi:MAG: ATP-dependent RNA helicase DbpA [Deltaproteobacteria bacterium]|nr:MAG: ATP-dependent RNA helicase DbpA [Deltaproteobacteria bacterium]